MLGGGFNGIYHRFTYVRRKVFPRGGSDRLTKYAHFCALSHPFNASTVATAFMETIQKLHGNSNIIVSDRDPIFARIF